jgi:hypothetical protein
MRGDMKIHAIIQAIVKPFWDSGSRYLYGQEIMEIMGPILK